MALEMQTGPVWLDPLAVLTCIPRLKEVMRMMKQYTQYCFDRQYLALFKVQWMAIFMVLKLVLFIAQTVNVH